MKDTQREGMCFIEYLLVFLLLYVSKDTLLFGTNSDGRYSLLLYVAMPVVLAGLIFALIARNKTVRVPSKLFLVLIIMISLSLLTMTFSEKGFSFKYAYGWLMLLYSMLFSVFISFERFRKTYVNIVTFLAVFSLAAFALRYVLPGLLDIFPSVTNASGYQYYNLGFSFVPHDIAYVTFRNYGIFREPGLYQAVLNLALVFMLTSSEKKSLPKFIVIIATIITTLSTSGYLICLFVFLGYVFFKKEVPSKKYKILGAAVAISIVFGFLFASDIVSFDSNLFNKLFSSNASANSRFGSIAVNAFLGAENVFLGKGYLFVETFFEETALDKLGIAIAHNTNTIMKLFSVHGAFYVLPFVIGSWKLFKGAGKGIFGLICLTAYFMMLSSEDFIFNSLIFVLMFYGFKGDYRENPFD